MPPISWRNVPALAWTGEEVVVWGGSDPYGRPLHDGAAYQPTSRTWRMLPPAPIRRLRRQSGAWLTNAMIVFGGYVDEHDGAQRPSSVGAIYQPRQDEWKLTDRHPTGGRGDSAIGVVEGELLAWGGDCGDNTPAGDGWLYRLTTNSWTETSASPLTPRLRAGAASAANRTVIFGGSLAGSGEASRDGAVYSHEDRSWQRLGNGPLRPRRAPVVVAVGDRVFIAGGDVGLRGVRDAAWVDALTGEWEPAQPATFSLVESRGVSVDGRYVACFGGYAPTPNLALYDCCEEGWSRVKDEANFWPGSGACAVSGPEGRAAFWTPFNRNLTPLAFLSIA